MEQELCDNCERHPVDPDPRYPTLKLCAQCKRWAEWYARNLNHTPRRQTRDDFE